MLLPLVSAGTPHTVPQRHGLTVTLQIDLHVVVVVAAGNDSHVHLLLLLVVGRGLLSVLWSGGLIDPLGGSIWCTAGSPLLVSRVHGHLEMGVQVRISVLGDVGGHLCGHGWNGTWNWLISPGHLHCYESGSGTRIHLG